MKEILGRYCLVLVRVWVVVVGVFGDDDENEGFCVSADMESWGR